MKNNVLFIATTLGLVLTVSVLTYSQQAFAVTMGGHGVDISSELFLRLTINS
jgi:hypothetical protein